MYGGNGDDTLWGDSGDDTLYGGSGNDQTYDGDGNDLVYGGSGDDDHSGGTGDDIIYGGAGDDTLSGGEGDDTIFGDSGDDSLIGLSGDDVMYGGEGNDNINGHDGNDDLYGGSGDDTMDGASGDDTLYGGSGNDTSFGSSGDDVSYGGSGDDNVFGGSGDDTLYGGDGDDTVDGSNGNDVLFGGAGDDTLWGDSGEDTLSGGSGDDTQFGGAGNDVFDVNDPAGNDVIYGGSGEDCIDLTDVEGTIEVFYDGNDSTNGTIIIGGDDPATIVFESIECIELPPAPCFTTGTKIMTVSGEVAVEDLKIGDLVNTMDNGVQPIRWIGRRTVQGTGNLAPVVFKAGSMGNNRDLRVSPQHRMLVNDWRAETLFGEFEVLSAAKHFVNGDTVYVEQMAEVEYFHILFDSHEIVFAEGAASESFHPGEVGAQALDPEQFEELMTLFPELRTDIKNYGPAARMSLKAAEGRLLAQEVC